ncbi:hypothetical protein GMA11_06155 [Granulicatella sp. zg-ZJ]|uniref:hypothetical protein n=1 Tax=Granulicatella sp. zg-ZJ TaxID=2678504 RepID=UPI0013D2CE6E|nr:hypothetical protein [Granulicatella sp. zg-ZJ]MBS4749596.1 hypothetical protein [Carnobacteriaceae bacterium zg-ZUI78]NEW62428.1 hypothetical protein [Granulicatella sp. zg-ZJ]NEW62974.1 hypothetical protein [Granulicatella sp. zg-ZJ]
MTLQTFTTEEIELIKLQKVTNVDVLKSKLEQLLHFISIDDGRIYSTEEEKEFCFNLCQSVLKKCSHLTDEDIQCLPNIY